MAGEAGEEQPRQEKMGRKSRIHWDCISGVGLFASVILIPWPGPQTTCREAPVT